MAKKTFWQKVKDFFSGSKKASTTTSNNRGGGYSVASNNKSNADSLREAYLEREKKKREEEERKQAEAKKHAEERKRKAEEKKKQIAEQEAQRKAKLNSIQNDVKLARNYSNMSSADRKLGNIKQANKEYKNVVNAEAKRMGVAPQVAQKLGSNKIKVQDIKSSYKALPKTTAFSEGVLRGATMGTSDIVKHFAPKNINDELKKQKKNYTTGQKLANIGGELAGSLVTFGGTMGASEKLGAKALGKVGLEEEAVSKLANSNFVKKQASKLTEKAFKKGLGEVSPEALARTLYKEFSTDLGINLGVGNVQAIIDSAETKGTLGDKLKAYAFSQGANALLGIPMNRLQASKGAMEIARKELADRLEKESADIASNRLAKKLTQGANVKANDDSLLKPNKSLTETLFDGKQNFGVNAEAKGKYIDDAINGRLSNADNAIDRRVAEEASKIIPEVRSDVEAPSTVRAIGNDNVSMRAELPTVAREDANKIPNSKLNAPQIENNSSGNKYVAQLDEERNTYNIIDRETGDVVKEFTPDEARTLASNSDNNANNIVPQSIDNPVEANNKIPTPEELSESNFVDDGRENFIDNPVETNAVREAENRAFDEEVDKFNEANRDFRISEASKTAKRAVEDGRVNLDPEVLEVLHNDKLSSEVNNKLMSMDVNEIRLMLKGYEVNGIKIKNRDTSTARKQVESIAQSMMLAGKNIELGKEWEDLFQEAERLYEAYGNFSGGVLQRYGHYARFTGRGATKIADKTILNLLDDSIPVKDMLGISRTQKLTEQDVEEFAEIYLASAKSDRQIRRATRFKEALEKKNSLAEIKNPDEVQMLHAEIINDISESVPTTFLEKMNQFRYLAMLGNPKTHIRNRIGNGLFKQVRKQSNSLASMLENVFKANPQYQQALKNQGLEDVKIAGGISLKASKQAKIKDPSKLDELGKIVYDSWSDNIYAVKGGGSKFEGLVNTDFSGKYKDIPSFVKQARENGRSILEILADINGGQLEGADLMALEKRYRETMYDSLIKEGYKTGDNLTKEEILRNKQILNRSSLVASQEAQISTFRDYNGLSNSLSQFSKNMTSANASKGQRAGAFVLNSQLPFVKTPVNIGKQMLNYSPIGIMNGAVNIRRAIRTGDIELMNKSIHHLSEGLTGTGIMALGFGLTAIDELPFEVTTFAGSDAEGKHKRNQGMQDYSFTFDFGGKKFSVTADWATPISGTFFAGAEIAKAFKDKGIDPKAFMDDLPVIASRIFEPVMSASFMSGTANLLESIANNPDDDVSAWMKGLQGMAESYITSYMPTLTSQVARTVAPYQMNTGGDNYLGKQILSRIPFGYKLPVVGEALAPRTDDWGVKQGSWFEDGSKKNGLDYALQGVASLFSPANISKVNYDDTDEALGELYRLTGDENVFPKRSYKKDRTYGAGDNAKELNLNEQELSIYNQARNSGGKDALETIFTDDLFKDRYKGMSTMEKAKAIQNDISLAPKSTKDVIKDLMQMDEYKNATQEDKARILNKILSNNDSAKANANEKSGEKAVIKSRGESESDYDVRNNLGEKKFDKYEEYSDVVSADVVNDFYKYAIKNGQVSKKDASAYFLEHPEITFEQQSALWDIFKYPKAKGWTGVSYGGSGSGRSGGRSSSKSSSKSSNSKDKKVRISKTMKGTYKSMATKKSTKAPVLKSNYTSKLKPPTPKK